MEWQTLASMNSEKHPYSGRTLAVEDGTIASGAALPDGASVQDGLDDYASGYDAGGAEQMITVRWELWERGVAIDGGTWAFMSAK